MASDEFFGINISLNLTTNDHYSCMSTEQRDYSLTFISILKFGVLQAHATYLKITDGPSDEHAFAELKNKRLLH
jgi:hypothetical protein